MTTGPRKRAPYSRRTAHRAVWTVALVGMILSISLFQWTRHVQRQQDTADFRRGVATYLAAFQERRNGLEDLLRTLRALFHQDPNLTRAEFHDVIRDLSIRLDGVQALLWTPRVQASKRAEIEGQLRAEGFEGFQFTEGDVVHAPEELPVRAADREEYFPVMFIEPYPGNAHVLGYDLASTEIAKTFQSALRSGTISISETVRLPYGGSVEPGFTIVIPVFAEELTPADPEARHQQLLGYITAVIVSERIMASLESRTPDLDLDVVIIDLLAPEHLRVLGSHLEPPQPKASPTALINALRATPHIEHSLRVGNREWALLFRRSPSWKPIANGWHAFTVLASGLLLTGLVAQSLGSSLRRTRQVEEIVEQRTAELAESNSRLQAEIDDRIKAQDQLAHDRNLLRTLTDRLPDSIFVTDREGCYLTLNSAHRRLLNLNSAQAVIGQPVSALGPQDLANALAANGPEIMESGIPKLHQETTLTLENDEEKVLLISKLPLRNSADTPTGLVVICQDVTEERQDEAHREAFSRRLQESQKLESLGLMAGGIAHDFNNLLTSMLGNADLAKETLPPDSPLRPFLDQVGISALRAADLCKQMLAYAGKGRFVVQKLDLSRLVEETTDLLRSSISKKITLDLQLTAGLCPISGDATQLQQILMNLVINAADAIGNRSGTISVNTRIIHVDTEFLGETVLATEIPEGEYVSLQITDDGCGMPPEVQTRIFDPFYTTKFAGRGLGLAAVLGIVKAHKGAMTVRSKVDEGTTFTLVLPCSSGPVSLTRPSPGKPNPPPVCGTILVADDDPSVRSVAASMLENAGFTVELAKDGREAVERFQAQPARFQAVLLDLTMPRMDGEEAFAEIRRSRADAKILLMSGFSPQQAESRFAGKRMDGFLQKPFNGEQLLRVLHDVLGTV